MILPFFFRLFCWVRIDNKESTDVECARATSKTVSRRIVGEEEEEIARNLIRCQPLMPCVLAFVYLQF